MTVDEATGNRRQEISLIDEALTILRGKSETPDNILLLAKKLKNSSFFKYARKLIMRALEDRNLDHDLKRKLVHEHSLCTYKDPDLPASEKFEEALGLLDAFESLQATTDQEMLGQAGAIYKRMWERDALKQHLERSVVYYRRGYEQGVEQDDGYTGINTAFILDLLADQELREGHEAGAGPRYAMERLDEARAIRQTLVDRLAGSYDASEAKQTNWWFLATLAEAYFGLGDYKKASLWLERASALPNVPDWEYESTARQLAHLALLQKNQSSRGGGDGIDSKAWAVLEAFLDNPDAVRTVFAGKVGMALSGGGFRASIFHIGVLARLAELDVLRHVEVLSCVSGGSIIGAHYYLEVRHLLQTHRDDEITQQHYLDIVKRIAGTFLEGVKENLRTRLLTSFSTKASKLGDMYEKYIFSKVQDGEQDKERWLNKLKVTPLDKDGNPQASFNPNTNNWRRKNKVPILILNATTLNTGHNWQFTSTWMGESPFSIDTDIDGNYRLRRLYYTEAPPQHQNIRLGHAVAASSCVPGLFSPITLEGLYPGKSVRLVDGGVHDNQGTAGLLEQNCTVMLVSDASGQMGTIDAPGGAPTGVALRANTILMARVREAQYREMKARERAALLRGFMFIHLKKDLGVDSVDWTNCKDPSEASGETRPSSQKGILTTYAVLKDAQKKLAAIRTDLDAFGEVESHALMTSGYLMTTLEFGQRLKEFPIQEAVQDGGSHWPFLRLRVPLKGDQGAQQMMVFLDIGAQKVFKFWKLSKRLRWVTILVGVLLVVGFVALFISLLDVATLGRSILIILGFFALLTFTGWAIILLHLKYFDAQYIKLSKGDSFVDL